MYIGCRLPLIQWFNGAFLILSIKKSQLLRLETHPHFNMVLELIGCKVCVEHLTITQKLIFIV